MTNIEITEWELGQLEPSYSKSPFYDFTKAKVVQQLKQLDDSLNINCWGCNKTTWYRWIYDDG